MPRNSIAVRSRYMYTKFSKFHTIIVGRQWSTNQWAINCSRVIHAQSIFDPCSIQPVSVTRVKFNSIFYTHFIPILPESALNGTQTLCLWQDSVFFFFLWCSSCTSQKMFCLPFVLFQLSFTYRELCVLIIPSWYFVKIRISYSSFLLLSFCN